ncbi:hypothetical protein [Pseudomonas sp. Marseille-Q5115]|uniref:hypothetical protein n=1 Tax=Pseudomonas sp. Marseille-Q5115 TaxID=2866593 RepID=UPI001CE45EE0|nr:hypothetical protein [Pseudomonas sp. Marseille-Q5115]
MLDAIVFGVMLVVVCVVGAGYYAYHSAKDFILDNSEISIGNECEGNVVGADDTLSRFVLYSARYNSRAFEKKICILDKKSGLIEFSEKLAGYKDKTIYSKEKNITGLFKDLPVEMAQPFEAVSLPRIQFLNNALLIVDRDQFTPNHIQAAVLNYSELNLEGFSFSRWPKDDFVPMDSNYDVLFEKMYQDADDYVVSWKQFGSKEPAGKFEQTLKGADSLSGLFLGDKVLISNSGKVTAYALDGHTLAGKFCCGARLALLPGNPKWIVSNGDPLRLWQTSTVDSK